MQIINSVPFSHLRNAEHVSFLTNVRVAITKLTPEALGITEATYKQYSDIVDLEQDIVNHSTGSVYTDEMKALDKERDRLFRMVHLKLQTVLFESEGSELSAYAATVEKLLLGKYGLDVAAAPYQEESAHLRGFILDIRNFLPEEVISALGISTALSELETANESFSDQYNERVTEKAASASAYAKKLRLEAEGLFNLIGLHVEFKANTDTTAVGETCGRLLAIINQLIKDVQKRLNDRAGKTETDEEEEGDNPVISPVPFPNK